MLRPFLLWHALNQSALDQPAYASTEGCPLRTSGHPRLIGHILRLWLKKWPWFETFYFRAQNRRVDLVILSERRVSVSPVDTALSKPSLAHP
jgi:hypothetical protein